MKILFKKRNSFLVIALSCLLLFSMLVFSACDFINSSNKEGENVENTFSKATAINGEGVSSLGVLISINDTGIYYFKYTIDSDLELSYSGTVVFNLNGDQTQEGTITNIEVYNSTKTLLKSNIEVGSSPAQWLIFEKNKDEELHTKGTYYLKVTFAKIGKFVVKMNIKKQGGNSPTIQDEFLQASDFLPYNSNGNAIKAFGAGVYNLISRNEIAPEVGKDYYLTFTTQEDFEYFVFDIINIEVDGANVTGGLSSNLAKLEVYNNNKQKIEGFTREEVQGEDYWSQFWNREPINLTAGKYYVVVSFIDDTPVYIATSMGNFTEE